MSSTVGIVAPLPVKAPTIDDGPEMKNFKNFDVILLGARSLNRLLKRVIGAKQQTVFETSGKYWEDRYAVGGDSGPGSYGRLAEFKASVLNDFVERRGIQTVLEFGCGDGAQLKLARYPHYVGVDVSPTAIARCRRRFSGDTTKQFFVIANAPIQPAHLVISMDVIYHLVEDAVFDAYMADLFRSGRRFVCIYSSNEEREWPNRHVRHRRFTDWIEAHAPDWIPLHQIDNPYPYDPAHARETSFSNFYIYERAQLNHPAGIRGGLPVDA